MKRLAFALAVVALACNGDKDKPTIEVFTAAPATIEAGQSTQLVFGATGTLTIDQGVGGVTGKTSVTVTPTSTTTYTLTASGGGATATKTTVVTVKPKAAIVTALAVVRTGDAVVAGAPATFEVRALTSTGTTAAGYTGTVSFTSDDGTAALPSSVTFTAADAGKKTVQATYTQAGPHTLTGTDAATGLSGTGVTVVEPAAGARCAVQGLPAEAAAGAQVAFRVSVTDRYGNLATGYTGTIGLSSSDDQAVLASPGTYVVADGGSRAFLAQLRTAGSRTVTAADAVADFHCEGTVNVVAGATLLSVELPALATPGESVAGTPEQVRVRAQDAQGNRNATYAGTVRFTSTDTTATLPADVTFDPADGGEKTVTVTFGTPAQATLTARDTSTTAITGAAQVRVRGLVYTDPPSGGKVRLVRNPSSTGRVVQLDLVSNTSLFAATAGTADTVRNGAFAVGMNLPLDATRVAADTTLLVTTVPVTTPASSAVLTLGTGVKAQAATLVAARNVLVSGVSQKRIDGTVVRGDATVRPFPGGNSYYYSLRLALVPGAATGTVFDGQALGAGFRAAVRDRSGSDVFAGPDFAIGKLEVR